MPRAIVLITLIACAAPRETAPLGLNDVTFLLPLPVDHTGSALIAKAPDLLPRSLFDRLVTGPGDIVDAYEEFHVVAARFDLCDRAVPGPCGVNEDGRVRLVLQPLFNDGQGTSAADTALHAFYPIPNAELADVINELRGLAGIAASEAPLGVNLNVTNAEYASRLKKLITKYTKPDALFRLTVFAQDARAAGFVWVFRGALRKGADFIDIDIPGAAEKEQHAVLLPHGPTYNTEPVSDDPPGFTTAIAAPQFVQADAATKTRALEAITAVQDPTKHTPETVQCVACHVATVITARRAEALGVSVPKLTSRYDLSIAAGGSTATDRSLRALGWFFDAPMISQRVVNETAQVLAEMDAR